MAGEHIVDLELIGVRRRAHQCDAQDTAGHQHAAQRVHDGRVHERLKELRSSVGSASIEAAQIVRGSVTGFADRCPGNVV